MRKFVEDNLIFMTLAGSHMYGMNTPESDIDKRGVCVPPKEVILGFNKTFEQQEYPNEDTVVFGLQKFMNLASNCNPNIIELLYAPEKAVIYKHDVWKILEAKRDEFLSAKAYHTFTGYALGQLKRIKTHRAWLLNPPKRKPTREEFGLSAAGEGVRELSKGIDATTLDPSVVNIIEKEKKYKTALIYWNQYGNWVENRNPKRAALEANYGYDTKHAAHLVRLLRMGKEILTTGDLTVRRPDANELLAIRRGKWNYDDLIAHVNPLQEELKEIYDNKTYVVSHSVDRDKLSDLCAELHEVFWKSS